MAAAAEQRYVAAARTAASVSSAPRYCIATNRAQPNKQTRAVTSFAGLRSAFDTINSEMAALTKGGKSFLIELSCAAGAGYGSNYTDALTLDWSSNTAKLTAAVTVQAAKGCEGDKRPVLSTTADPQESEPYFYFDETLTPTTKMTIKLTNLILDGGEKRRGISVLGTGSSSSYTQTNVDIINMRHIHVELHSATGLVMRGAGSFVVTGGKFQNNKAYTLTGSSGGGALDYGGTGGAKAKLSVSKVTFEDNKGKYGAAALLLSFAPTGTVSHACWLGPRILAPQASRPAYGMGEIQQQE